MSHSAHRCGTVSNLQNDYTMYARTSRYVNREGCGPRLRKILEIFLSENPVNFGSSHSGKSFAAGLDPEEYARSLDKAYAVACCFSKPSSVLNVLKRLKEADTGISIVVSGLIEEVQNMADEIGLTPHTALLSLGVHGRKELLPEESVLEITTMCGHGLVATHLVEEVAQKVRKGRLTAEEGAMALAQPCPCGIFNLDRCRELLAEQLERISKEGEE
jgi:hypothetical protein